MLDVIVFRQLLLILMRKLFKLKEWYPLEDAAKRLSVSLEEEVSVNDLFHMAYYGHLNLSVFAESLPAVEIAPCYRLLSDKFTTSSNSFRKCDWYNEKWIWLPTTEKQSQSIFYLKGVFRLDLEHDFVIKDWLASLMLQQPFENPLVTGCYLRDRKGGLWQTVIRFDDALIEEMYKDKPKPEKYTSLEYYYPSDTLPTPEKLGCTKADLESFEQLANTTSKVDGLRQKSAETKERDTLLKIIIGMAYSGYVYKPNESKSRIVPEIANDINKLGIQLTDDTVRKWLNEASKLVDWEVIKGNNY